MSTELDDLTSSELPVVVNKEKRKAKLDTSSGEAGRGAHTRARRARSPLTVFVLCASAGPLLDNGPRVPRKSSRALKEELLRDKDLLDVSSSDRVFPFFVTFLNEIFRCRARRRQWSRRRHRRRHRRRRLRLRAL